MRLSTVVVAMGSLMLLPAAAAAASTCDPDGIQASGSIYRICMPPPEQYNGMLVIWAHGFQDAGTPVEIPEGQLCVDDVCLPGLVNSLGFAFATNSYSKTGLAVLQGKADILDLVQIFAGQKGQPSRIYLVGASEGGLITALAVEQHPDVFSGGVAACGPIGSFPLQINYFGDARATFEYFFPGVIPGHQFNPDPGLIAVWNEYYQRVVKPIVFDPAHRYLLDQWVKVARLPFDANDYLGTVEQSVNDVLRYSVVNLNDATATLGGFPFDNKQRWYTGSDNDFLLNLSITRVAAAPAAIATMNTLYQTTGVLQRPLITLHTLLDQQVPYAHEPLYDLKTFFAGSFLTRHVNFPVDRFGHCNFTRDEALFSFAVMLFYDAVLQEVSGTATMLKEPELLAFEWRARATGLPNRRDGKALSFRIRPH
jgi:pimeloyl-ACP methyl ester carboxylesterase